ncbi:VOC family protein [Nocardioides sp.]|uniref:VOC family protein n=1 Tax=Nocardioides sp. TaxID=35761 RepID=UPI00286D92B2|nr:VOC family protein [Nocardioides sp.]
MTCCRPSRASPTATSCGAKAPPTRCAWGCCRSRVPEVHSSHPDRAWVEAAGWGRPSLWFVRVPEGKTAKNRQHFDLRPMSDPAEEVRRLVALGARVLRDDGELVVLADPEGNEFCVE